MLNKRWPGRTPMRVVSTPREKFAAVTEGRATLPQDRDASIAEVAAVASGKTGESVGVYEDYIRNLRPEILKGLKISLPRRPRFGKEK